METITCGNCYALNSVPVGTEAFLCFQCGKQCRVERVVDQRLVQFQVQEPREPEEEEGMSPAGLDVGLGGQRKMKRTVSEVQEEEDLQRALLESEVSQRRMLAGKNSVTATPLDSPGRADIEEPEDLPTALMNRQRIQAEALGDQAVAVDKRFLVEQEHESLTQQLTVAVGEIEALTREREALALDNKAWQLAALRHEESLVRERNKSARLENENFALQERVRELEAMLSNKKDPRGAGMEVPTFRDSSSEASRLRSELEAETAGLVSQLQDRIEDLEEEVRRLKT